MKKKITKRLFSLILVLVMCISLVPASAFATEADEAEPEAYAGETIDCASLDCEEAHDHIETENAEEAKSPYENSYEQTEPEISPVKVTFVCEQLDDLSGLYVYDAGSAEVEPYFDEETGVFFFDTYYLLPGDYSYSIHDESGKYQDLSGIVFSISSDCEEQNISIDLTEAEEEETPTDLEIHSITVVNPIYEDVVDESDIPEATLTQEDLEVFSSKTKSVEYTENSEKLTAAYDAYVSSGTFHTNVASAGAELKGYIVDRNSEIKIYYQSTTAISWNTLCQNIYSQAVTHTGVPTEGDYIQFEYGGYSASGVGPKSVEGSTCYTYYFIFAPLYYTTAAQEQTMTSKVSSILSQLNLSNKSEYQKIQAIYNYLCANVTYDYTNLSNSSYTLKYTGYAALVNKTAVCQGYAVAFYRLCLESGIDARIIDSDTMCHAWNIARFSNNYYELDATWDAGQSNYSYFLKGSTNWLAYHKYNGYSTLGDQFNSSSFASTYTLSSSDADNVCGAALTWEVSQGGILRISGTGEMYDYTTRDGTAPWYGIRNSIKSVSIDYGVTGIGDYAFYNCSGITEISIPNSVTSIGNGVFLSCSGLGSITVSSGNTVYHSDGNCLINTPKKELIKGFYDSVIPSDGSVTSIGNDAFSDCSGLTEISIPNSVTRIGNNAFYGCSGLSEISIPNSVTSIGNGAFSDCSGLTEIGLPVVASFSSIFGTVPSSLRKVTITGGTSIAGSAFSGCSGLTSISISNSVTDIGENAFSGCTGLTEIGLPAVKTLSSIFGTVPSSLRKVTITGGTSIVGSAFSGCSGLTSIIIPNSVTSIGNYAFNGCSGLTEISIPNSVTSIGDSAFDDCRGLTSIIIPNSVTNIGSYVFVRCSSLSKIVFTGKSPSIKNTSFYRVNATVYYPYAYSTSWNNDISKQYGGTLRWADYCGMNDANEIVPHSLIHHEAKAPTYTETGWKEYDTCTRCDYTTYEELPVKGWVITCVLGDERAENSDNPEGYEFIHDDITLAKPTLNGYAFAGWYLDENLTTKADAPQIRAEDTGEKTFYAKWSMNSYSVKFNSNGGMGKMTALTNKTDADGELVITNSFKRTGYKFSAWNTKADGTGANTLTVYDLAPYADAKNTITLYAQWQPIEYNVVFDANGGTGEMESVTFVYGTAESLPANTFTKIGYTFAGWKCGGKTYKDGQSVTNLTTTAGATVTMVAQWKADTFKIAFDSNGGTGSIKPVSAIYDKTSAKLPSSGFKKTGWILKGWSLNPHDDEVEYSFDYQCGAALTAAQVNELYSNRDADNTVTLYAVWGPVEYKITYKNLPTYAKGSIEVLDNSMNPAQFCTQATPQLAAPTVPGYAFEGWFTDSKLTKPVTDAFWTGAAKTVYAKVTPINYSIDYDLQGGAAPAKGNKTGYTIKTAVSLNSPTRYGYTFAGWYLNETKVTKLAAGTYYGGDIELSARWTPNSYTLVLNGNGGTVSGQTKFTGLNTNSVVELPSLADREVYRFEGWSTKNDGTGDTYKAGTASITAAKNKSTVTLYAIWKYSVTLNPGTGEGETAEYELTYGQSETVNPDSFSRKGYCIAGWNTDAAKAAKGTVQYKANAVKNIKPGTTLYAVWKPITYKVVFHNNIDGVADKTKTQTLTYDKETALTANSFTWKGHTFQGWRTEDSIKTYTNKEKVINLAEVQGDEVHLYAIWN